MPTMTKNEETEVDLDLSQVEEAPQGTEAVGVKTIVRSIAGQADYANGIYSVDEVDAYLTTFRANGWDLKTAELAGRETVDGQMVFFMVYVLVR